jgi:septum formation protein
MRSEAATQSKSTVVLASSSPRRRQLLELIGLTFRVVPADVEETPRAAESPASFAERAARDKAIEVSHRYPDDPVLGADTVVDVDGSILGKPGSKLEAEEMLRLLAGREHMVHTALSMVSNGSIRELVDTAAVRFAPLDEATIRWYVETCEPLDKAGAYAIQGLGGLMVEAVKGSPHTVVGLPIHRLPELFEAHGLDFWGRLKPFTGE